MRNKLITIISLPVLCIASVWAQEKTTGSDMLQFDETTISASTVSGKELMKRSNINPANALYGKLNGLFIRQNGEYGDGEGYPSMNIRGIGSLNNNSILVFVDGLERDINSLVLEEIEEITILKDAAALAPYGIRGANGVILVKTKRGKKVKLTFMFPISIASLHLYDYPKWLMPPLMPKRLMRVWQTKVWLPDIPNKKLKLIEVENIQPYSLM